MPDPRDAALQSFLESQDVPTLVAVLLELADDHDAVRERLARLQLAAKPVKLAAAFRKTLAGWKRSTRFIDYGAAPAFCRDLQHWLAQVERELLPRDPAAALELAEAFIESDRAFFERVDDSGGALGALVAAACRLWLQAAARCESPREEWPARIHEIERRDAYGARAELLHEAGILLDEGGLAELARLYEQDLHAGLLGRTESQPPPHEVFAASGALGILSDLLGDPDLHVRSVLAYSPQPGALAVQQFAEAYLRHGRPADALRWLEGRAAAGHELSRQRLLARTLRALERRAEAAAIRQQLFEASLAVADLHEWLDDLAPTEQVAAMQHARQRAVQSAKPVAAALLLLDLGDDELAETTLVEGRAALDGREYTELAPLARELERRERWRGATCAYRALLADVLARAYSPAYPHAAKYWLQLQAIADRGINLDPLLAHADYAAQTRKENARKVRFWACVVEAGGRI